jgi:hypothetical protein
VIYITRRPFDGLGLRPAKRDQRLRPSAWHIPNSPAVSGRDDTAHLVSLVSSVAFAGGEVPPVSSGHRHQPEGLGLALGIRLCPTGSRRSR